MSTVLLIDGENFKGKIKQVFNDTTGERVVWHEYDFRGLLNEALDGKSIDRTVFYFGRLKEYSESLEKSRQLIKEQRLLKTHLESLGFEVVLAGRVRRQQDGGSGESAVFKEKGVDVKIAVDMITLACDDTAREIILGSSDSDLQPAIKEVRHRDVACVYLGFEMQPNKGMMYTTSQAILIRNSEVLEYRRIQESLLG